MNFDLYYVHDGVILEGHRHDWEGVTVVFKKDSSGVDWWHRDVRNSSGNKHLRDLNDPSLLFLTSTAGTIITAGGILKQSRCKSLSSKARENIF